MIIQGSNNPLVIQFDADISGIPTLVVTLWCDLPGGTGTKLVKQWSQDDMAVNGDTVLCQITEAETKALPANPLVIEAKGLDANGNTVFWDAYTVDVKHRRDKAILLTQTGG